MVPSRSLTARAAVRRTAAAAVLVAGLALLLALAPSRSAQAAEAPTRISGPDRFHTAANIATATFEQADVAHVVTGTGFADALAGSFAAGSVDGPVLLSTRDAVPAPTRDALDELGVERVVLIGGTGVIGEGVADELADAGYAIDRISGANRFQTASAVAMRYGEQTVGTMDGQRTALMATGAHFADALAAGPIAASERLPLFLTPPDRAETSVTRSLEQLDIEKILLLGGSQAVTDDVEQFYRDRGYAVERIGGPTLMDTAWLLADTAVQDFGFSHEQVLLARGNDYPDALAASIYGATRGAPIVLSATSTDLSAPTSEWFTRNCPDVATVTALGGTGAISHRVREDAVRAARACAEIAAEEIAVAVTADGRLVVLDSTSGEEIRQLMDGIPTDDPAKNDIAVTPDQREVYVTVPGDESGESTDIVRVPVAGGEPETVATDASSPAISPDGDTLAWVVHVGDVGDPDPRLVRRDLSTGEEVRLSGSEEPFHFVSDVTWTADGQQLAFTVGEINTGVHTIAADAASMDQARRLGPGDEQGTDVSWSETAAFDQRLAVVETCCELPREQAWHIKHVDPSDGSLHGRLMADGRVEATHLDGNAEATGLLAVIRGGPDGGRLDRWNGAGEAHTVTDDVIVAAW